MIKMKLDETDLSLLDQLRVNAKQPIKEIAKAIGVHHNTLLQRLKRLERLGVIRKYVASVDFQKTGLDLHVIILMKVISGRPGDTSQFKEILKMNELEALYATTGAWDAVSLWRVRNREHLNDIIRRMNGCKTISDTHTQIVLYPYKDSEDFNPFKNEKQVLNGKK